MAQGNSQLGMHRSVKSSSAYDTMYVNDLVAKLSQNLKDQFKQIYGLHDPTLLYESVTITGDLSRNQIILPMNFFVPVNQFAVQIHYSKSHYVLSMQDEESNIFVYDSLLNLQHMHDIMPQLKYLYKSFQIFGKNTKVTYCNSSQQGKTSLCGGYCTINAWFLLNGFDPSKEAIDAKNVQKYIEEVLRCGYFPDYHVFSIEGNAEVIHDDFGKDQTCKRVNCKRKCLDYRAEVRKKKRLKLKRSPSKVDESKTEGRSVTGTDGTEMLLKARMATLHAFQEMPIFPCTICHRIFWKSGVVCFDTSKYDMENDVLKSVFCDSLRVKGPNNKYFICWTCKRCLKGQPRMPCQAAANNLALSAVPKELDGLNDLERHLISLRIPFMKLLCLPRGRQKGIRGPAVNVPARLEGTTHLLPRIPADVAFILLDLKRRLRYKGYYKSAYIRPQVVLLALSWLKCYNEAYADVICQYDEAMLIWEEQFPEMLSRAGIDDESVEADSRDANLEETVEYDERESFPYCRDKVDPDLDMTVEYEFGGPCLDDVAFETKEEKKDFIEDQEALDERLQVNGMPLQTAVQLEDLELNPNGRFCLAPAESQRPKLIIQDEDFEKKAFPDKFPTGKNTFSEKRTVRLSLRRYYNQRLLNYDSRFANDTEYLFAAQYACELDQLNREAGIAMRKFSASQAGPACRAGYVAQTGNMNKMLNNNNAVRFQKKVRGTPAYWATMLYDLLGMIKQWPEIIQAIGLQHGHTFTAADVENMDYATKCFWLNKNPVTSVRTFRYRLDAFFKYFMRSAANPIGKIIDYVIRIEFQVRELGDPAITAIFCNIGSPHAHILIWIDNAPTIDEGKTNLAEVAEFVDKYVSGDLPDSNADPELYNLVQKLQSHKHSAYCRRKGMVCRFNFPHPPTSKTVISGRPTSENEEEVIDMINKATLVLEKVKKLMLKLYEEEVLLCKTYPDILAAAGVTQDEYERALSISVKGHTIHLKRGANAAMTNNYNADVLRVWQANMDLQYVLDPYSAVMYVASYMMKNEKSMGDLLTRVSREFSRRPIKEQMRKLNATLLNHREVSAQEAACRLLSIPLRSSTRDVKFVNTQTAENRLRMLKSTEILKQLDDDSQDIFMTSDHERYAARPDIIGHLCFAEFVAWYEKQENVSNADDDHCPVLSDDDYQSAKPEDSEPNSLPKKIKLMNNLGNMRLRRRMRIIRTHRFSREKERDMYFFAKILLYHPWRSEDEIGCRSSNPYMDYFALHKEEILAKECLFVKNEELLDEAILDLESNGPPQSAWNIVSPNTESIEHTDLAEGICDVSHMVTEDTQIMPDDSATQHIENSPEISNLYRKEALKEHLTDDEYRVMMRNLNDEQRDMVQFNRNWCKSYVQQSVTGDKVAPYHVFLSGAGGTGKSHVIKMIYYDTVRILRQCPTLQDTDKPIALLSAFTGVAAFNINGLTVHNALGFSSDTSAAMSAVKKATLCNSLSQLRLLIIDEVSMVPAHFLRQIDKRLCLLKNADQNEGEHFGNISVLLVGDLLQLPPIGAQVFKSPAIPKNVGELVVESAWSLFRLHELHKIMRQRDSLEFAQLCCRIRTNKLSEKDVALLRTKDIGKMPYNHPSYPKDCHHVFPENVQVDEFNEAKLEELPGQVHVVWAEDRTLQTKGIKTATNSTKIGGLISRLKIKVGARVMLTSNIDNSDGLSNGACGYIREIVCMEDGVTVDTILVEFDEERVGQNAKNLSPYKNFPSCTPVKKFTFEKKRKGVIKKARTQFPLCLAWATTVHKVQGKTMSSIVVVMATYTKGNNNVVKMKKLRYREGQFYVAVSRVTTLSGLTLVGFYPEIVQANKDAQKEMEELAQRKIVHNNQQLPKHDCGLSVAFLNVNSFRVHWTNPKFPDIRQDVDFKGIDILCFAETEVRPNYKLNNAKDFNMPSKAMFHTNKNGPHHGLAILISVNLQPQLIPIPTTEVEVVFITTLLADVLCLYRRPHLPHNIVTTELKNILPLGKKKYTIIVGDFNEDILKCGHHPVHDYLRSEGFSQLVKKPTHNLSLIDHIYVNVPPCDSTAIVSDTYYSDHDKILASVKL